ncbi:copper resistance protein NlpE N-terminal domain-containing protein [Chitinophaga japonensis]|uniref:NlpE-like protein n=1 Tax=Chitinophaga japonensis TaxID=104662 RepID=A0A562TEI3_CHIJA|nr:copper resistance protein NlpE N-terminal domain-containing protein [Chitinophaga japonensis]TWI91506.1 NlpE-like protein [Chitinophaga japonensis]
MHYQTLLLAVMLGILTACNSGGPREQEQADSSAAASPGAGITGPSAKAAGSYQGVLPCADCPGIDYQLSLYEDHHYRELRAYRDRNHHKAFIDTGRWQLENDSIVRLLREQPQRFLFQDGKLYHLDQEGHRITGMLADNYILRPVEGGGNYARLQEKAAAGADFWAVGNEPGWTLELDRQKTLFFLNQEGDSLRAPTPRPRPNTDTLQVYTAKTEKAELILTIRQRACMDDMSGFMRPYTVEVQFKDRTYTGCGESL